MKKAIWISAAIGLATLLGVANSTDLGKGQFSMQDAKSGQIGEAAQTYPAKPLNLSK